MGPVGIELFRHKLIPVKDSQQSALGDRFLGPLWFREERFVVSGEWYVVLR